MAVVYTDDVFVDLCIEKEISAIWDQFREDASRIVVDVPIGLFEQSDTNEGQKLVRKCDVEARKVVGPQYRSVFNPPCRDVVRDAVEGFTYSDVKEDQMDITGKGLTQQAYAISEGIYQVDELLEEDNGDHSKLFEGHPEVSFRAFAGSELQHPKSTVMGVAERLNSLARIEDDPLKSLLCIGKSIPDHTQSRIEIDDVLDAMALALTAGASEEEFEFLPVNSEEPPRDASGRPQQMVYRSHEPLGPID